ncbi:hypothetical protein FO519_001783 [Halicephalobus sp. NKZ332]|nr:hypothetical protein FO519_001783 [Halicephalobus sp. NKZ332]
MIKAAILCLLLAFVVAEETATGGAKDAVGKGYGNNYGGHDGHYGGNHGGYGHHGHHGNHGHYPPYGHHHRHHRHEEFDRYGNNYNDRSRHFTRQFCRYAAAHSKTSCSFCCQVAARAVNTSPDDITSAIFSFDPTNPTAFGAGADEQKDEGRQDGPYRQKRDADAGRIRQCVCCAPKH